MWVLGEFSSEIASDLYGRGIIRNEFRMLPFKSFQLFQKHIELIISHDRGIIHIISPVGVRYDFSELLYPYFSLVSLHISVCFDGPLPRPPK